MSLLESWRSPPTLFTINPETALRLQVGALSPLWLPVAGAAAMGLAAWSFGRWMRLAAPDALLEAFEIKAQETQAPEAVVGAAFEDPQAVDEPPSAAIDPVTEAPLALEPEPPSPGPLDAAADTQATEPTPVSKAKPIAAQAAKPAAKTAGPAPTKKAGRRKESPTAH